MKIAHLFLMLFATPAVALATTPLPFAGELGLLDRVLTAAGLSETRETALKLLECVAEGHTDNIQDGWEAQVGLAQKQLRAKEFSDPYVRAHALWNIGETGLPEALEFLAGLTPTDFRVDASGGLWADSRVALSNALLRQIAEPQMQIDFLVHTMKTSIAAPWAADELCNRGISAALPDVRKFMRTFRSGQAGDDDVKFCESRMQVVARNPDRAKALGSVFSSFVSLANSFQGQRLLAWAIENLGSMKSPEADAELDRFRDEIGSVLQGDPGAANLLALRTQINSVRISQVR
jgi:hypothetical protein